MSIDFGTAAWVDVLASAGTTQETPRAVARFVAVVPGAEAKETTDTFTKRLMVSVTVSAVMTVVSPAARLSRVNYAVIMLKTIGLPRRCQL
jgi:hypothetical protein